MMYSDGFFAFHAMSLIPLILFALPFAIGFYFVAERMGRSPLLWAVLMLIPIINFFFFIYAMFSILLYVLDRLNQAKGEESGQEKTPG